MSHRPEQVANLIKEELSKIISHELEFPDLLMTITDVKVDNKLEKAIVNFSVLSMCGGCPMSAAFGPLRLASSEASEPRPDGWGGCHGIDSRESFEIVLKILEKNRSHLQYLLMRKINIKPMPKIEFKIDRGLEKAAEFEKLLLDDKINKKR